MVHPLLEILFIPILQKAKPLKSKHHERELQSEQPLRKVVTINPVENFFSN